MNATTANEATLEAARHAVIDSLTRAERQVETAPEVKKLDESSTRRPGFRSVRLLITA